MSERFGGWLDLPSEAACWGEAVALAINEFVASNDFRESGSGGTVSEVAGRKSKDGRGSDLAGCNSTAGNSVVDLDVDSDGRGGGRGSIGERGMSCRGNGRTGIAGNCGGLLATRPPIVQGGREVSILETVLLLPCRFSLPLSFGVGVAVSLSLSSLGRSVDLLPKDIRLMPPINTRLPSISLSRSRSFPLCLSLETDRTIR